MESVPVVDLQNFLTNPNSEQAKADCKAILDALYGTSCLIVKDPRASKADNDEFLTMMENYFNQSTEKKMKDTRPEFHYQVGSTPEFTEVPRDHEAVISELAEGQKPIKPNGADAKWRFFWRAGERPEETAFEDLNMPQVIPEGFPEWETVCNKWSTLMLKAVVTVTEMLSVGLDLPMDTFSKRMQYAPHLLAPTGSDLGKYNELQRVFAGFHYDLNFLTIHGKSRFPGLHIWLREGKKIGVKVPDGCLLLQAGKQLEWLTGGFIKAGFHEVVVTEDTKQAIEKAKEEGRPLWRVSTTLFSHIASDQELKPLKEEWNTEEAQKKYPPTKAGDQVSEELKYINLKKEGEFKLPSQ